MDLPKFIIDNLQLIKSNLGPFIVFLFLTFALAWFIFTLIHKERLAILQERLSSKNEQLKYYKELSETKQPSFNSTTDNIASHPPVNNLKEDIRSELQFLKQHAGKAISMQLFERLQPKYDFTVILSEIILMNKNNELKWDGSPNPPEALSEMSILK